MIKLGTGIAVPDDFVTARVELLGMSGAGKSNALAVMVEGVYDIGAPLTWIDPFGAAWGVRSSDDGTGPGLSIPIFGGYHADLPLQPSQGAMLARELHDLDASAVIDLSAFTPEQAAIFTAEYSNELFALHLRSKKVRAFFVDEGAHLAPQTPTGDADFKCAAVLQRLHTGGRAQGIGLKIATQSAAEQSKRTMKQAEMIVALRTFSPLDQKPVVDYLRTTVEKAEADKIKGTLAKLKDGEAWFIAPRWLGEVKRGRFRMRRTFDSSQTPKVGQQRREPRVLAAVELENLRRALEEGVTASADSDNPAALLAQIAALEHELADARAATTVTVHTVEVPALSDDTRSAMQNAATALTFASGAIAKATAALHGDLAHVEQIVGDATATLSTFAGSDSRRGEEHAAIAPRRAREISVPPAERSTAVAGLKAGAVRMLQQLARCGGILTKSQLATLADVNKASGTFYQYLAAAVRASYVEDAGDRVRLLHAGARAIGEKIRTEPPTTKEIVAWYSPKLKAGERRILDLLIAAYPREIKKDTLATEASVNRGSGTFYQYVKRLSRLGLVDGGDRRSRSMRASAALFLNGGKK